MNIQVKHEIEHLINRYIEDKCTKLEEYRLYELLSVSENELSFKEILFSNLNKFEEDKGEKQFVDFEKIYSALNKKIKEMQIKESEKQLLNRKDRIRKTSRLVVGVLSIAAVFFIAFFLGSLFGNNSNDTSSVLSASAEYNEFRAPIGSKSEILLSDGTEVILNAGSSLKYNNDYNSHNRDLILKGEAYFKVARNKEIPLIVSTENLDIKAIGTEFNVKAYSEEGTIETTLIEGEVEIVEKGVSEKNQTLVLKPNQKAIYTNKSDQLSLEEIRKIEPLAIKPAKIISEKLLISPKTDTDQAIAWTKDELIIKSENLETLCIKLQRKYDVKFVFNDEQVKKFRFNGTLLDETFEQVMEAIKLTAPIDYSVNGKTVILVTDKAQLHKYSVKNKE
jgi:ferric-dicitrate binding protein FerR (iron transport regulator)